MSESLFWLCAEVRAPEHASYRGFGLLIDWDRKEVVRRFDVPVEYDAALPEGRAVRECRGVRQVRAINGRLHVLTQGGQLILDPATLEVIDRIDHPWHCGGHYLIPQGDRLWYNSAVPDAIVRLTNGGAVERIIHLCDAPHLVRDLPIERFRHDEAIDLREKSESWIAQEKHAGRVDQLHINTLQVFEGRLYAFSCTFGALVQVEPEVRLVFRDDTLLNPHDGQLLSADRIVANDSGRSRVVVYDAHSHERTREIEIPVPPTQGDDPPHAKRGYVRGLVPLAGSRVLVGSAPLSLFEVDLERGEVMGEMILSDDPAVTSHGICRAA